MKTAKINNNFALITGLILIAVIFRIISNQLNFFNFTPLIAIALFAGAKFDDKKWAVLIPVVILFISDIVLAYLNNFDVLHNTILFTYGSLLLIILLGRFLYNSKFNIGKTVVFSLSSSLIFFVISNIGVWLFSNLYTLDFAGLTKCFVLAIPFNKFSWFGDLFFVFVLFSIYELVSNKSTVTSNEMAWQKSDTID